MDLGKLSSLIPRLGRGALWRAPILLLTGSALCFYLALPYRGLDADATTFGLMGNDLLRHGYLPTLTYGQNYLFSLTPYLYALVRWLMPSLSVTLAFAITGSILSLGGLWLIYEALLTVQDTMGRRRAWPLIVFCVLVGCSPAYMLDISCFSSIEVSLFLLGLVMFAAARIDRAIAAATTPSLLIWGVLGAACGFAVYSRAQVVCYAVPAIGLLLPRLRNRRAGEWKPAVLALAAGVFIGYVPMLLHTLFRAPLWPFGAHLPLHLGKRHAIAAACLEFFTAIVPRIFSLSGGHLLHSSLIIVWIGGAIALFAVTLRRAPTTVSAMDGVWGIGSLMIALVMILFPMLSRNEECRRYCLHLLLGAAWLFARYAGAPGWRRVCASLLIGGIVVLAIPQWHGRIAEAREKDRQLREAEMQFVPYLKGLNAPILTQYWDAYLLAFLSDGTLRIEAYPWDLVRTYGLIQEVDMRRRTIWLVRSGYVGSTWDRLIQELGGRVVRKAHDQNVPLRLCGHECELWEFDTGQEAVALMKKYHPRYFTTPYPPGSRAAPSEDSSLRAR